MQAKAIVGGKLVSFKLSPELARVQRANAGRTMTDEEAVACVEKKLRSLALRRGAPRTSSSMTTANATAEVFVTAFKSLKLRQLDAVLGRMFAADKLSADFVETLRLESRRHQPRQPFRQVLKDLGIRA